MLSAYHQMDKQDEVIKLLNKMEREASNRNDFDKLDFIHVTIRVAKWRCSLENYEKVNEHMKSIPPNWNDYRCYLTELFETYNRVKYGQEGYGEAFFADWNLQGDRLKGVQEEFYFQAALKAVENKDFENAKEWAPKAGNFVSREKVYKAIAECLLRLRRH